MGPALFLITTTSPAHYPVLRLNMLQKIHAFCAATQRLNSYCIKGFELGGIVALFLLMLVTFIDVLGAKLFLAPIFGALDIAMLAQLTAISFGTASALVFGKHISVNFFLPLLPGVLRKIALILVLGLSLGLFLLLSWNLFRYGYSLQAHSEVSPTANIALFPFAYGAALALVPVCVELFVNMMNTIFGFDQHMGTVGSPQKNLLRTIEE
jgi:TRAP-type C4-dicarboxylate transport system permease small subunit